MIINDIVMNKPNDILIYWKRLSELVFGFFVVDWQSKTGLLSSAPTRKKTDCYKPISATSVVVICGSFA